MTDSTENSTDQLVKTFLAAREKKQQQAKEQTERKAQQDAQLQKDQKIRESVEPEFNKIIDSLTECAEKSNEHLAQDETQFKVEKLDVSGSKIQYGNNSCTVKFNPNLGTGPGVQLIFGGGTYQFGIENSILSLMPAVDGGAFTWRDGKQKTIGDSAKVVSKIWTFIIGNSQTFQ
jgi:hypothetical protein